MNQRELLLGRCRASSRVRHLAASAIVTGVRIRCRQSLDMSVADVLAVFLTPTEAVNRFVDQAAVPRRGMTGTQLDRYRTYLVTKEAIDTAENTSPHFDERLAKEILASLQVGDQEISCADAREKELEQMGTVLEQSGPSRRRFYRRADRLWRKQRSRLKAAIHDPSYYEAALADLGAVYVRVFRELLEQDDRHEKDAGGP